MNKREFLQKVMAEANQVPAETKSGPESKPDKPKVKPKPKTKKATK
jgi:hypothetical protein